MKTKRIQNLVKYINELLDILCTNDYKSDHYTVDFGEGDTLEVGIVTEFNNWTEFDMGWPTYHSEMTLFDLSSAEVHTEDGTVQLDKEQLAYLCSKIKANNTVTY